VKFLIALIFLLASNSLTCKVNAIIRQHYYKTRLCPVQGIKHVTMRPGNKSRLF